MGQQNDIGKLSVNARRNYSTVIFAAVWLIIFFIKFRYLNEQFYTAKIIVCIIYVFTAYFSYQLLWNLFSATTFTIENGKLTIASGIGFLKVKGNYATSEISNMRITLVNSSSYWGFQGVRFYETKSKRLTFFYNGKEINYQANLSEVDLNNLKKWIGKS